MSQPDGDTPYHDPDPAADAEVAPAGRPAVADADDEGDGPTPWERVGADAGDEPAGDEALADEEDSSEDEDEAEDDGGDDEVVTAYVEGSPAAEDAALAEEDEEDEDEEDDEDAASPVPADMAGAGGAAGVPGGTNPQALAGAEEDEHELVTLTPESALV